MQCNLHVHCTPMLLCIQAVSRQGCGMAMSDSYIKPAGQVDFPG